MKIGRQASEKEIFLFRTRINAKMKHALAQNPMSEPVSYTIFSMIK